MPRDAFGREVGEDPLADLGWGTSTGGAGEPDVAASPVNASTVADASPSTAAPAPTSYDPPPAPVRLQPPGADLLRIGRWIRSLVTLGILAAVVFGGISAFNAGSDAVDEVRDSIGQVVQSGGAGDGEGPGPIKPARSLLARGQLATALAALRRDAPGRLLTLRVAADRVDVTLRTGTGRTRIAQFRAGAEAASIIATTPGAAPSVGLFGYRDVEPAAMVRALAAARRQTDKGAAKVDYLTFTGFGGQLGWGVYYRSGEIVQADARGRFIRRIS